MELKSDARRVWTFSNGDLLPYRFRLYEATGKPSVILVGPTEESETQSKRVILDLTEENAFRLMLLDAVTHLEDGLVYIEEVWLGETPLYFHNPLMGTYGFSYLDGRIVEVMEDEEDSAYMYPCFFSRQEQLRPSEVAAMIAPFSLSEQGTHERT